MQPALGPVPAPAVLPTVGPVVAPDGGSGDAHSPLPGRCRGQGSVPADDDGPVGPVGGRVVAGRYRLGCRIGRGGMGEVHVAVDEHTGRTVALKSVRSDRRGDAASAALAHEARILRRVRGPHVVAVVDEGTDGGDGWLALERLAGRDLEALLERQGRLSWQQTVGLLLRIARALVGIHDAGVAHADLKPANVFVCAGPGGRSMVKLIDFGISRVVEDDSSPDGDGWSVAGTAGYLAPERIVGGSPSTAGDLYALGVIAWTACAGREPFVASSTTELLLQHAFAPTPRLGTVATVPAALDDLVQALLAKEPQARPAARAVVAVLARLMQPSTVPVARLAALPVRRLVPARRRPQSPAVRVERIAGPLSVLDPWSFPAVRPQGDQRAQRAALAPAVVRF